MAVYILVFFAALAISLAATPVMRRVAIRLGVVDMPGERKIHASPIPLLGGVAVYLAFVAGRGSAGRRPLRRLPAADRGHPRRRPAGRGGRLLGRQPRQASGRRCPSWSRRFWAPAVLIWAGIQVEFLREPVLNVAVTVVWVVGITNALNFLDNMDGLSSGVAAVAAAFFFLLAITNGQFLVASLSAAPAGRVPGLSALQFHSHRETPARPPSSSATPARCSWASCSPRWASSCALRTPTWSPG